MNNIYPLNQISPTPLPRFLTGLSGFDKVLGGGILAGSTILFAGLPGSGKTTLLMQVAYNLALGQNKKILYVAGEENKEQIKMRTQRLLIDSDKILILEETAVEKIIEAQKEYAPDLMIIDSIQTLHSPTLRTAVGTPTQIRNGLFILCELAKQNRIATFFIDHSTKGGYIGGMQTFQHMVDVTLYLGIPEEDPNIRYLRANKNRFGDIGFVWELYMTKVGLTDNPVDGVTTYTFTSSEFERLYAQSQTPQWQKIIKNLPWYFKTAKFQFE